MGHTTAPETGIHRGACGESWLTGAETQGQKPLQELELR